MEVAFKISYGVALFLQLKLTNDCRLSLQRIEQGYTENKTWIAGKGNKIKVIHGSKVGPEITCSVTDEETRMKVR